MMNKKIKLVLLMCFNLICTLALAQKPKYQNLSALEFYEQINTHSILYVVDVRAADEQIVFQIENSVLLQDKASLLSFIDTLDVETPILVYCNKGERSLTACKLLCGKGFVNVANLKHGFIDYKKKDYPVEIVKTIGL